jgi:hypothetical protein
MFQDYQNIPETLYNESMVEEDFDKIYAALKAAEEKDLPISVINDIIREYDPNDLEEWIDDRYDGQFESDEQLGEHWVEMTGGIENMGKDTLERYFDYERFGRDLAYDYSEFDGYYFRSYKKGGLLSKKRKSGKVDAKAYERLAEKVAAYYVGKPVPKKYQSKYGTTYDEKEAKSVGFAVATKLLGRPKYSEGGHVRKQEWIAIYQHQNMQRVIVVHANTEREAIREAEMSRNSNGIGNDYELVDIYTYSGNLPMDFE